MNSKPTALFVYGTLRPSSKHPMARALSKASRYVGTASVPGRLVLGPGYPCLVEPLEPGDRVIGDVVELENPSETLAWLDDYEGLGESPPLFVRETATAQLAAGGGVEAWVYRYAGSIAGMTHIPIGDWLSYSES